MKMEAKCNICDKVIFGERKEVTHEMMKHLETEHKDEYEKVWDTLTESFDCRSEKDIEIDKQMRQQE